MLNKFLRNFLLVGIFAIPFIPLIVSSGYFFPFITGKNFAFRIIVELMLASWVVLAILDTRYRPKKNLIIIACAIFLGIIALADFFGENPYRSFWSNYERMEGLISHLHLFAYTLISYTVIRTEKLWERLFNTSLAVNAIINIYALFQIAGLAKIHQGGVRVDATLGNATYLAVYVLFHIFISAFLFAKNGTSSLVRSIYGAMILIDIFVLYHTATRGAILGLIFGVILTAVLVLISERKNPLVKKLAAGGIVLVVLAVGSFFLLKDTSVVSKSQVLSRFSSISLTETTTKSRFMVWDMSWQGFKEHPILGWGQENFILVFNKHYNPNMFEQEPWFDRSHNVFFDWMVAGGLLGILSYLSIFGTSIYYLWRKTGDKISPVQKSILTGALGAYFFHNLFVFDNLVSYVLFFMIIAYIASTKELNSPSDNKGEKIINISNSTTAQVALVVTIPILVISMYIINVKPILASGVLIDALSKQGISVDDRLELFKKASAYNTFGNAEIREQLTQNTIKLMGTTAPKDVKQKFLDLSSGEIAKQIEESPKDSRYEFMFGAMLNKFSKFNEATDHLNKALALSPKKQQILFEAGTTYLNKGEYDKALEYFKKAVDLAPQFDESKLIYSTGLIYAGKYEEAEKNLNSLNDKTMVYDDRIVLAYYSRHQYVKTVELLIKKVESEPGNYKNHLMLADAYLATGDRSSAIEEINRAIEINSSIKTQGEKYIEAIRSGRLQK